MTDLADEDCRSEGSFHASFVVRCWVSSTGDVHGHVVDVRTGVVYPLADLSDLGASIHRLLQGRAAAAGNESSQD